MLVLLVGGLAPAMASGVGDAPLAVSAASVRQDGQSLVWRVSLGQGFTAAGLKRDDRALCLLIEPRRGPSGRLCVVPRHRGMGLRYSPSPGRHGRSIAATISRSGPRAITARFLPSAIGGRYTYLRWQVVSSLGLVDAMFPAAPVVARLHVPRLVGCAPSGPSLVYHGASNRREIALTFDDGPWGTPSSMAFVKLLARLHAPATFFEIGDQIAGYDRTGSVERQMLAAGDMIGDHTWSHPDMPGLSPARQRTELQQTVQAIRRRTGFTPCLWRPPYGAINSRLVSLARGLGLVSVNWDIDPRDWALPGTGAIVGNVLTHAHNGAIVIEHFGGGPRYQTLNALPAEIRGLRARGYRLVTVTQLLGLRLIYK